MSLFGGRTDAFDPFFLDLTASDLDVLDVTDPSDPLCHFPTPYSSLAPYHGSPTPISSSSPGFTGFDLTSPYLHRAAMVDWKETPFAEVFRANLPGLKKDDIKVEVADGRVLKISGERSHEKKEKADTWHLIERSSGKFLRSFRLPENAKVGDVRAAMENGVLTITILKVEPGVNKSNVRSIEISG